MAKIEQIQFFKSSLSLNHPFITNKRSSTGMKSLIYKITLSDGSIGLGEASENINLTGVNLQGMLDYAVNLSKKILLGQNVSIDMVNSLYNVPYNPAHYGIETAVIDAFSRSSNETVNDFLGIPLQTHSLENDTTVSIMKTDAMIKQTQGLLNKGYRHIKYKIGPGIDEVERLLALQDILPENVSIRIDPNQAWTEETVFESLKKLTASNLKIDLIEQPVSVDKPELLKKITMASQIPIAADESVFSIADAKKIIANHEADILNIKLIKCGGPLEAIQIANIAEKNGIDCMLGCTSEINIAISTAAYLSASLTNVKYYDLDGLDFVDETPFKGGVRVDKSQLKIPKKIKGLGITMDEHSKALKNLTTIA